MVIKKKPFVNYQIGEKDPFATGKVFTVRLNPQEYADLRHMEKTLRIHNDSTMLKTLAKIGINVLHNTFSTPVLRWLSDPERRKDESKLEQPIPQKEEIVTQNPRVL